MRGWLKTVGGLKQPARRGHTPRVPAGLAGGGFPPPRPLLFPAARQRVMAARQFVRVEAPVVIAHDLEDADSLQMHLTAI